jgi:hypothetical protein
MRILQTIEPSSRAALIAALLLAAAVPACGDRAGADQGAGLASGLEDGEGTPARIEVDPCALLTKEELSEQLYLSLRADERANYETDQFDIEATEPSLGTTRVCEYKFASRDSVGGGPTWHSDFTLMVFPSNAIALAEDDRKPIDGAGPGMFKERGTAAGYYVVKGGLAVTLTRFPGRGEDGEGGPDAGRVVLLRRIAERLP